MNLNRNNYEEFFLLYVDGELNPTQMQLVEEFVQANPDLQEELDMLRDAVLSIDNDIVFADKNLLYKSSGVGSININNYQENFLLYVDNELNKEAKESVETFVLKNPALQDEFTLLKQTKLQVEHVACPNKESLYKKEERPVVFMWMKRLSVAAAILFLAVMAWMLVPNKMPKAGEVVVNEKGDKPGKNAPLVTSTPSNSSNTGTKDNETKVEQQPLIDTKTATAIAGNKDNKKTVDKVGVGIKTPTPQHPQNKIEQNKDIALAPQQQSNAPRTQEQKFIPIPKEQQVVQVNNNIRPEKAAIVPAINNNNVTALAQPAVYRELNTDDEQEAKTVYIGSLEIKKDKINNLFKKAKKFFGKKQNDDVPTKEETRSSSTRTLR
jgi:transcription elongation GreA/GreB family factor